MQATGGIEPITLTVKTGRGRHLYFECPEFEVPTNAGHIARGIDLRGEGGFVVAPPSRHATGAVYAWTNVELAPMQAPDWLLAVIERGRPRGEPTRGGIRAPLNVDEEVIVREGVRNDTLFRVACSMRARGYELEKIQEEISVMNEEICEAPLPENELATIAKSASAYPKGNAYSDAQHAALMDNPLFWLPLNIKEFLGNQNVTLMTDRQRGWYICLIVEAWQNGGQLPNDPTAIYRLSRADCGYKKFGKDAAIVLKEFSGVGSDAAEIIHPKLQAVFQEQLGKYEQKKAAGQSSARKRQEAKQAEQAS
jgi:uncharacterized protein YdaU (DUF1376 family)